MILISKIAEITAAKVLSRHHNFSVKNIFTDSRQIINPTDDGLFIALSGEHFNGNRFLDDAYNKGLRNFIVDETLDITPYPNSNILWVQNTTTALQQIATFHRQQFNIPILGITGSNGKTIVKEWLSTLLEEEYNVMKSPGSYNSQIGVPLSVWQLNSEHTLGLVEAGISKPGEMEKLEKIIAPTIGIFTSLGDAHNEGFVSNDEKLIEKLLLFTHCKTVVINHRYKRFLNPAQNIYSWSTQDREATIFVSEINSSASQTEISYLHNAVDYTLTLPFADDASIENAITCLCTCLLLNISNSVIASHMLHLQALQMRLSMQRGNDHNVIINDAYNADLNSLKNALGFMHKQVHKGEKIVVLSDILQSGKTPDALYQEIGILLSVFDITRLIGVGEEISKHQKAFSLPSSFFASTHDLAHALSSKNIVIHDSLVLLKGARKFRFEEVAQALSAQHHTTCLEINLNAIAHNFHVYKKQVNVKTKIMVMVKAFSYGSGSHEIASLLQFHKADYLAVAYSDEGVQLRNAGVTLPIMVMNAEEKSFDLLLRFNLEPALYSLSLLQRLARFTKENISIHLEFETGMHRLGLEVDDTENVLSLLKQNPHLKIKSIFSHLASAEDESDDAFTLQQIESFRLISEKIKKEYPEVLCHLLNSPGISRWAEAAQFDMVRLGIGLYGIDPTQNLTALLLPASTLKSSISQIKKLYSGDSVSYNRRFLANKEMRIATIPIGYADGLNRALGNGCGSFIIQGKPAPILGTVCMDMTMVDVTDIPCIEGDEVIVFGEAMPVTAVAANAKTISYEILSTLSQRIKRVYLHE
ncbi:MAG: bifunctional UDP-N-acetylmuramoyl-tripeptide:D-alanyl-D-alanine ligase/alanine racemase [Bacteroidetes bacterium]|nr:bifunctional UDP-N-acetylmuramoyl-tripeptide:D-alanyl-D-alanine ligase/alanine racemase [Bacteroidota bacterium]